MRHELLTQRAFCIGKKGMLSQHFVTNVVPPDLSTLNIW